MTNREYNGLLLRESIDRGQEQLTMIMECLDRAKQDVSRYEEQYRLAQPEDRVHQEDVLAWVANALVGVMPNLRVDLLVTTAARIASARGKLEANT